MTVVEQEETVDVEETATQTCTKCGETKPFDQFDKDSSKKSGYRSQCRPCRRSTERKRTHKATPASKQLSPAELRRQQARQEAHRQAILRLIDRHRTEFDRLVYSEQVKAGVINLNEVPRENWVSLV